MTPIRGTNPPSPQDNDVLPSEVSVSSSEDADREEEPWNRRNEALVVAWLEEARLLSVRHDAIGERCEGKHRMWALPSVLLPTVMAPITATLRDYEWSRYLDVSAYLLLNLRNSRLLCSVSLPALHS